MLEQFKDASGFVFDCDGCLLDSMTAWRKVEFALIDMAGVEFTQEMLEDMRAASMTEVARVFHEKYDVMDSAAAISRFIDESMERYYEHDATPKPGAREFVTQLRAHDIPCCIVSASPLAYLESGMQTCGMRDLFCDIISTKETGISKQDPRIYQLALEKLGAQAASAWGVDDSLYAIRVMDKLGIQTIGIYDDDAAGTLEQLKATATIAITSFDELL